MVEARTPVVTWDVFRVAILQRFTPSQQKNVYDVLLGLQQAKSVAQYREDFELHSAPLKDADEAVLIGIFINGLQEESKAKLSLSKLDSLTQIMDQSQRIEDKSWALSQAQLPKSQRVALPQPLPTFTMQVFYKGRWHYRRLSDAEYHDKLKKGFCFRCDEKYGPNHQCFSKQLNLLIGAVENVDEYNIDEYPRDVPRNGTNHLNVASMLTPNQFEAELLTKLRIASETDGREACNILHAAGPSKVVITSINIEGSLLLIGSHLKDKEQAPEQFKIVIPRIPAYFTARRKTPLIAEADIQEALGGTRLLKGSGRSAFAPSGVDCSPTFISSTVSNCAVTPLK
ncbi:hypothetical protein V6N12_007639 [Hibiscus sabdariffa]|uniref:pyridoxal kinase n=1 Tax=Hibiscus sabdariffa TaxID=183260 RepID=A0ABR2F2E3_9ROSI